MSYDIDAIKKKIAELSNQKSRGRNKGQKREKLAYFKPKMGANEIRFLPYDDGNGQPFQQIDYYNSRQLTERRIVAPAQWGLPDPVADLVEELQKDRGSDTSWNLLRQLRVKESYYAPVLVRGQEDKGVQIWEIGAVPLHQVYSVLAHPDYADENLFDPKNGYDFTITCTDSGKTVTFGGQEYPVKNYDVQPRRKSTPLAGSKKEIDAILEAIPNLSDHFKQYAMSEEKLKDVVVNFLSAGSTDDDSFSVNEDDDSSVDDADEEVTSKIEDAFKGL